MRELNAKNGELYLNNSELNDKKEEMEKVVEEHDCNVLIFKANISLLFIKI